MFRIIFKEVICNEIEILKMTSASSDISPVDQHTTLCPVMFSKHNIMFLTIVWFHTSM